VHASRRPDAAARLADPFQWVTAAALYWIKIYDDHEPWYKGDPEIYMKCTTMGAQLDEIHYNCGEVDLPGVNEEDTAYSVGLTARYNFLGRKLVARARDRGGDQCELLPMLRGDRVTNLTRSPARSCSRRTS